MPGPAGRSSAIPFRSGAADDPGTLVETLHQPLDPESAASHARAATDRRQYDIITGEYAEQQPGDFGCEPFPLESESVRHAKWHSTHTHVADDARKRASQMLDSSDDGDTQFGDSAQAVPTSASADPNSTDYESDGSSATAASSVVANMRSSREDVISKLQAGDEIHGLESSQMSDQSIVPQVLAPPSSVSSDVVPPLQRVRKRAVRSRQGGVGLKSGVPQYDLDGDDTGRFSDMGVGTPVRDLRLDPVQNIAKWIAFFGDSDSD